MHAENQRDDRSEDRSSDATGYRDEPDTCICNNDVFGEGPCRDCRARQAAEFARATAIAAANLRTDALARDAADLAWARVAIEGRDFSCGDAMILYLHAELKKMLGHGPDQPLPSSQVFRLRRLMDALWADRITPLRKVS